MARDKTDETDETRAARLFAQEEVKCFLQSEPSLPVFESCPVSYFLWWRFNLTHVDGPVSSYVEFNDNAAYAMCETALEHEGVRRLVLWLIASRIENEMRLSPDLRRFAYLALMGLLPKPRKFTGPKISQRFGRDQFIIYTLMDMKTEFGVSPTENDVRAQTSTRQPSGMNILAQCFKECGRHEVTPRTIKDVWLNTRKRAWADRIEKAILDYQEPPRNALALWSAAPSCDGNSR